MTNRLTFETAQNYLDQQVNERSEEMMIMEDYARSTKFPIIGPVAGSFCYQIARMIGATSVFEMGSGYGYSTAWFARAVQENGGGVVHHVVWDVELSNKARLHLERLGYDDIVQYHVAEAVETLENNLGPYDLIFNDIDKDAYPSSLEVIERSLKPGGVLIVDNMLLGGRILDQNDETSTVMGVRELTAQINASDRWIMSIVPIRDGLLLAYRVS